jgi:hypothetical protein
MNKRTVSTHRTTGSIGYFAVRCRERLFWKDSEGRTIACRDRSVKNLSSLVSLSQFLTADRLSIANRLACLARESSCVQSTSSQDAGGGTIVWHINCLSHLD